FIMAGAVFQYFMPNTMEGYTLASALCVILFMSIGSLIMVSYIRYRYQQPEEHEASSSKMPGGVWRSYMVLIFLFFGLGNVSLEPDTMKALMIRPLWLMILFATYHLLYKPRARKRQQLLSGE